jgi:hypothetical protein
LQNRQVQLIYTSYKTPAKLIFDFDMEHLHAYYDGKRFCTTREVQLMLQHSILFPDFTLNRKWRLVKMLRYKIDNLYVGPDHQEWRDAIQRNSHQDVVGKGGMLKLDMLPAGINAIGEDIDAAKFKQQRMKYVRFPDDVSLDRMLRVCKRVFTPTLTTTDPDMILEHIDDMIHQGAGIIHDYYQLESFEVDASTDQSTDQSIEDDLTIVSAKEFTSNFDRKIHTFMTNLKCHPYDKDAKCPSIAKYKFASAPHQWYRLDNSIVFKFEHVPVAVIAREFGASLILKDCGPRILRNLSQFDQSMIDFLRKDYLHEPVDESEQTPSDYTGIVGEIKDTNVNDKRLTTMSLELSPEDELLDKMYSKMEATSFEMRLEHFIQLEQGQIIMHYTISKFVNHYGGCPPSVKINWSTDSEIPIASTSIASTSIASTSPETSIASMAPRVPEMTAAKSC